MKQLFVFEESVDKISTPEDLFKKIQKIDIDFDKEHFLEITLNAKNQLINTHLISIGILNASLIHPREVFRKAIQDNANSILIAHNHPSNCLEPSENDKEVTSMLKQAGELLGIEVLDHIIFNESQFYSMKEGNEF